MGFTTEELRSFSGATVPDLIGDTCGLLFVGINPGLWTAATLTHFCHPSNRFYPALRTAALIDFDVETSTGMTDEQRAAFVERGMGITNIVARATARASELSKEELIKGGSRLVERVATLEPRVVAVAGLTAYRTAFGVPGATTGPQAQTLGGVELWVVPNPSGLNAHETVESLAGWYGKAAAAAGLT